MIKKFLILTIALCLYSASCRNPGEDPLPPVADPPQVAIPPATPSVPDPGPTLTHAVIKAFTVSPSFTGVNFDVCVSWDVADAVRVELEGVQVETYGSRKMKFADTATLTLAAWGSDGQGVYATARVEIDKRSACQWVSKIVAYSTEGLYFIVTTARNDSPFYPAKNVVVRVVLYDKFNAVIDQGQAAIAVIMPGQAGSCRVYVAKTGIEHHSIVEVVACDCNF